MSPHRKKKRRKLQLERWHQSRANLDEALAVMRRWADEFVRFSRAIALHFSVPAAIVNAAEGMNYASAKEEAEAPSACTGQAAADRPGQG